MLQVKLSPKSLEWAYDGKTHSITIDKPVGEFELVAALHELGHAHYHHPNQDVSIEGTRRHLAQEVQAWGYAFRCLKPASVRKWLDCAKWAVVSHVNASWAKTAGWHNITPLLHNVKFRCEFLSQEWAKYEAELDKLALESQVPHIEEA